MYGMFFFLMFKHSFCWKYQYNKYIPVTFNKYMFNFIDLYSFIPGSGCVDIGPKVLFARGPIMLLRRTWLAHLILLLSCWVSLVLLLPKTFNLFGFQLFWFWAYLMRVITLTLLLSSFACTQINQSNLTAYPSVLLRLNSYFY